MLLSSIKKVFSRPPAFFLAALITVLLLYVAVWVPNLGLLASVLSTDISLWGKITFVLSMISALGSNFTILSASYTTLIAILFSLNVVMIIYLIRVRSKGASASLGKGGIGLVAGALGVGCASCGALLLTPILGTALVGAIAAYLPLGGAEFGILGVIVLAWSTYSLARRIDNPYT